MAHKGEIFQSFYKCADGSKFVKIKEWKNNWELQGRIEKLVREKGFTGTWDQCIEMTPFVRLTQDDLLHLVGDYERMIQKGGTCATDIPPLVKSKLKLPQEVLGNVGSMVGGECKYKREFPTPKYRGQDPTIQCTRYAPLMSDLDFFDDCWQHPYNGLYYYQCV